MTAYLKTTQEYLKGQLYVAKQGSGPLHFAQPGAQRRHRKTFSYESVLFSFISFHAAAASTGLEIFDILY